MLPRRAAFVAVAGLILASAVAEGVNAAPSPASASASADAGPLARPGIRIVGDAGFLDPLSGVRGGSGTEADPYVLSDYVLAQTQGFGVQLVDTTRHVVIEDVVVAGAEGGTPGFIDCKLNPPCHPQRGVHVLRSSNVTIRRLTVGFGGYGVFIEGSDRVAVVDSRLGLDVATGPSMEAGVYVVNSRDVLVQNVTVRGAWFPLRLFGNVERLVASGSDFAGEAATIPISGSTDVRFDRSTFSDVEILASGRVDGLSVVSSEFRDGITGFLTSSSDGTNVTRVSLCDNSFEGFQGRAVSIHRASGIVVLGNRFRHNGVGADIQAGRDLVFERNLVENSSGFGSILGIVGAEIHQNAFLPSGSGTTVQQHGTNATLNWWGDPSGPTGKGGTGEKLNTGPWNVQFSPWLGSPPDLAVDCGTEGPIGATPASIPVEAFAGADVRVRVH